MSRLPQDMDGSGVPKSVWPYPPFTSTGRGQLGVLGKKGIGVPAQLERNSSLNWKGLQIKMSPRHLVHQFDLRYYTEVGHSYGLAVTQRYLADEEKPLWFKAITGGNDNKPIVRSKAKYRMNAALKQALRNAGYDAEGRRLSEEERQRNRAYGRGRNNYNNEITQLYGTVMITSHEPKVLLNNPFDSLRLHFEKVVRVMEEELGRTADGRQQQRISSSRPHHSNQNQLQPQRSRNGGNMDRTGGKTGPVWSKGNVKKKPQGGFPRHNASF